MLEEDEAPTDLYVCGFDKAESLVKICCPTVNETSQPVVRNICLLYETDLFLQSMAQPARFPVSGKPRPVKDFVYNSRKTDTDIGEKLCGKWKHGGGCLLSRHFFLDEENKDDPNSIVWSRDMFRLMLSSCPKTCGWAPSGCHDEHRNCPRWSRLGYCARVDGSLLMAHTCRESCGVCGFLSHNNKASRLGLSTSHLLV